MDKTNAPIVFLFYHALTLLYTYSGELKKASLSLYIPQYNLIALYYHL